MSTESNDAAASTTTETYQLSFSLQRHSKAVNSLVFNQQGTLLASGGDDEEVHIWDLKTQKSIQQLSDGRKWGQITVIKFVDLDMNGTGNDRLFFGTGRGRLAVYRRDRKNGTFVESGQWKIFGPCESVEALAIEPHSRLIAASSQHGTVQLLRLDGQTMQMQTLWCESDLGVIPRSLLFVDRGASVMIFGMESGTIWYRDCETSQTTSVRHLRTPIGEVDFCSTSNRILVDNMRNGFDLYPLHKTTPCQSFSVKNTKKFIKAACFAEQGKVVVCGSDHGCAYVFSSSNTSKEQVLKHGSGSEIIQTSATVSTKAGHFIATTASTGDFTIKVWKKKHEVIRSKERKQTQSFDKNVALNVVLVLLLAFFAKDTWLPALQKRYTWLKTMAFDQWTGPLAVASTSQAMAPAMDFAEAIHSLDDDTVRKLFRMGPKLTEAELHGSEQEPRS